MAKLNETMQRFIVQALACYDTPTQVAEAVKEEFGIEITRQQVASYDPTKVTSKALARKWQDLFSSTRERFRREIAEIPIAGQAFRLRQLHRMLNETMKHKNIVLAASLLEQAAKEVGDVYVNRRLDPIKPTAQEAPSILTEEYTVTLKPDEDVPDRPIL